MSKVNYDAKRAQILKQIYQDKVKAKAEADKQAKLLANQAPVLDDDAAINAAADKIVVASVEAHMDNLAELVAKDMEAA